MRTLRKIIDWPRKAPFEIASIPLKNGHQIIGPVFIDWIKKSINRYVIRSSSPISLIGETGTGKELLANYIFEQKSSQGRLVIINCAAIPVDLLEAELFGYAKGAFTGANQDKAGKIELADGGVLFLDEISELPKCMQAKLLRVLNDGEVYRIGENRGRKIAFKLVTASNVDIRAMINEGKFRKDLFFRINCFPDMEGPVKSGYC